MCTDEMREDFIMSMKKAIVDFVLKDPKEVCNILLTKKNVVNYDDVGHTFIYTDHNPVKLLVSQCNNCLFSQIK